MSSPFTKDSTMLLLDIGSGTQDVLYVAPDVAADNRPKFVLPSPARVVAWRIAEATYEKKAVHLCGVNMGGGFFGAVKKHLETGLAVSATLQASTALHDSSSQVEKWGVSLREKAPEGAKVITLGDFDADWWRRFLGMAGLEYPDIVVAAAQDHGVHEAVGNREGRFVLWRDLVEKHNGDPKALLYTTSPVYLTRLRALQESIGGGPVADSAAAAVLGALSEPEVYDRSFRQGVTVINAGNSHLAVFLVYKGKIWAVYEHHTGMQNREKFEHDLSELRKNWITDEEVRSTGGHGCTMKELPAEAEGFHRTYILGPRRNDFAGLGTFLAPSGDMMLAGCFGLLYALGK